ncbi:MAG TPA: lamin tail domain-containing protein [Saprospiraceae bacterium]|nr:lamin tail domain-containing protein [Saprospiraceae bacterium]HMP13159.1 lamin tail domain-containing protein [Saprospiraceae bacterium]
MKQLFFFCLFCFSLAPAFAQFSADFNNGNLSQWLGDTARFIVNAEGQLQLRDNMPTASNTAWLAVAAPTSLQDSTTWEFFVRLHFAASATNFARVYLASSQPDLNGPLNGYFLRIGGIAGNDDALDLFRQDGTSTTLLVSGTRGAAGGDPVIARVRITRNEAGVWRLFADYTGGINYQPEAETTDTTHAFGAYFGFYCRYTSTRNQAFFFDDVYIAPLFEDRTPPKLQLVQALSAMEVEALFDEALQMSSAENPNNYRIEPSIGAPVAADLTAGNRVSLLLGTPLSNGTSYTLVANNIADRSGNVAQNLSADFAFLEVQTAAPGDVLITEIMADPTPVVDLPDAEWIELYNRSNKIIQLEGCTLRVGTSVRVLPAHLLLPGQYVVVCATAVVPLFQDYGPVIGVGTFPALPNNGGTIQLSAPSGLMLFQVAYTMQWYQNTPKSQGGWTLEMIDLERAWDCAGNWRASEDPKGGTPAAKNSLFGTPTDNTPPSLLRANALTINEVLLIFNEALDSVAAADASQYRLSGGLAVVQSIASTTQKNQVRLVLSEALRSGQIYTVTVGAGVTDCFGNGIGMFNTATFGLAEPVQPGDLVINEVLYQPNTGGSRFVELHNISNKIININGLQIINAQRTTGSVRQTITTDYLLAPDGFVAISDNVQDVATRYMTLNPNTLLESGIPTLETGSGNVTIQSGSTIIDAFDYTDALHFPLLSTRRGVSLERINPRTPTNSSGNWHSAAASVGFATPGYRNSQFLNAPIDQASVISIPNKTFSPDNDGFEDVLLINYRNDQPGLTLNLRIFDAQGRPVRQLLRNELLAAEGSFKWDGTTDNAAKARIGVYILWIELFAPDGRVEYLKETCVLAGKLR